VPAGPAARVGLCDSGHSRAVGIDDLRPERRGNPSPGDTVLFAIPAEHRARRGERQDVTARIPRVRCVRVGGE